MPSFSSAFLALAIASLSVASPVRRANTKAFTIQQSVAKPFTPGPAQLAKAITKYGGDVPSAVQAAASGEGSVTATPEQYDSEYLCPVTIGGQTLNLDFDSGSADL